MVRRARRKWRAAALWGFPAAPRKKALLYGGSDSFLLGLLPVDLPREVLARIEAYCGETPADSGSDTDRWGEAPLPLPSGSLRAGKAKASRLRAQPPDEGCGARGSRGHGEEDAGCPERFLQLLLEDWG